MPILNDDDPDDGECELLGPFAILVQMSLAAVALLALLLKRQREHPRRPFQVWSFDVAKQMIGALELHFTNIFLSDIASRLGADSLKLHPNPCVWYFLNLFVDCTIGVPILWVNLKILHRICRYFRLKGTRSGDYGGPPPKWTWWFRQVVVYCIGVSWMKIATLVVLGSLPYLDKIGEFLIGWTKGNTATQIIFVMFISPLVLNTLQYLIVDEILLARVLEQKPKFQPEYTDEDSGETADDDLEDDETEYDIAKGRPAIV